MKVGGIIHIPIFAWRREGVMRIGEGYKGEERFVGLSNLIQKLDRAISDKTCGIKIIRYSGPNGLWACVVMGKLVIWILKASASGVRARNHCA